jgi:hypothetical protein
MRRKRSFSTFNLSFLDIMSCGFGAIVLLFLIIDHANDIYFQQVNKDILAEVSLLEEEVLEGKEQLVRVRNTINDIDQQMAEADGLSRRILEDTEKAKKEISELDRDALARIEHINSLKTELKNLEEETARLKAEGENERGEKVRQFLGEGDRQYLTGLKLGGRRLLILLDSSTSMLDDTIVNIIRLRNMSDEKKRNSEKWQRAVSTVEWLTAQLPRNSDYQILSFNTKARPILSGTDGQWLSVNDKEQLAAAMDEVKKLVPAGGTSLENLFREVRGFSPLPDNIYLITDGLPTQGRKTLTTGTVSGKQRLRYYNQALRELPNNIPVNVILAPLEGDHMAASAFWRLAQATRGSFLSPSKDWP